MTIQDLAADTVQTNLTQNSLNVPNPYFNE